MSKIGTISDRKVQLICKEYVEGSSIRAIATKYKFAYSTVRRCLLRNNVVLRNQGGNNGNQHTR